MKFYYIKTFGCQMNEHDSEKLAGVLEGMGYFPAAPDQIPDILLVNTCCVRETAEHKALSYVGRLRFKKARKPQMIIGVCGCMAQREGMASKLRHVFPHVDLIFGTHNIARLPALLERIDTEKGPVVEVLAAPGELAENMPVKRADNLKAWVPIIYGCNNFCTYCIVPYVRGRERSRKPEDIIKEVEDLGKKGYKEIILLGQNVNSYGKDLKQPIGFAGLLKKLNEVEGIQRIRYTTSHPRDFTGDIIDAVAKLKKVCENFHLPVQAGSNRVLKMMNRGYTREYYIDLIQEIRKKVPGAAVTTDIMVGFPGETEEDFEDTLDLVERVRFDSSFTFIYNKRPGTPAAKIEDQVPEETKRKRIQALIALQNKITLEKNSEEIGNLHEVLVEGTSEDKPGIMSGRSRTNKVIVFKGDRDMIGKTVLVEIKAAHLAYLEGFLVKVLV